MTVLEQADIWGSTHTVAANGKPLGPRQQAAFDYVRENGACTAGELGQYLHALKGKHGPADECRYCWEEGRSVLRSKAMRPLVIQRRTGNWEPRERQPAKPIEPIVEPSEAELAANPFAGLS